MSLSNVLLSICFSMIAGALLNKVYDVLRYPKKKTVRFLLGARDAHLDAMDAMCAIVVEDRQGEKLYRKKAERLATYVGVAIGMLMRDKFDWGEEFRQKHIDKEPPFVHESHIEDLELRALVIALRIPTSNHTRC